MISETDKFIVDAKAAIAASSRESSIYIGCDSLRHRNGGNWYAEYSVCIVLHKDSKHGGRIFHKTFKTPDYGNMKQRLINEAVYAAQVGTILLDVCEDRRLFVHLDLNRDPAHRSNVAVNEAIGYVRGLGLNPVIKPDAFAATHASDHLVRHKNVGW